MPFADIHFNPMDNIKESLTSSSSSNYFTINKKDLSNVCHSVEGLLKNDLSLTRDAISKLENTLNVGSKRLQDLKLLLAESKSRMVEKSKNGIRNKDEMVLKIKKYVTHWNRFHSKLYDFESTANELKEWNTHKMVLGKIMMELSTLSSKLVGLEDVDDDLDGSFTISMSKRMKTYLHRKYNPIQRYDGEYVHFLWDYDLTPLMRKKKELYMKGKKMGPKMTMIYQIKERLLFYFIYKSRKRTYFYKPVKEHVAKIYLEQMAIDDSKPPTPISNKILKEKLNNMEGRSSDFLERFNDVFESIVEREFPVVKYDEHLMKSLLDFLKGRISSMVLNNLTPSTDDYSIEFDHLNPQTPLQSMHSVRKMVKRVDDDDDDCNTHDVDGGENSENGGSCSHVVEMRVKELSDGDSEEPCPFMKILYLESKSKTLITSMQEKRKACNKKKMNTLDTLLPIIVEYGCEGKYEGFAIYPYTRDPRVLYFYMNTPGVNLVTKDTDVLDILKKRRMLLKSCNNQRAGDKVIQHLDVGICTHCFEKIAPNQTPLNRETGTNDSEKLTPAQRSIGSHNKQYIPPPAIFADNLWFQRVDNFVNDRKKYLSYSEYVNGIRESKKSLYVRDKLICEHTTGEDGKYYIKEKLEANPRDPSEYVRKNILTMDQTVLNVNEFPTLEVKKNVSKEVEYVYYLVDKDKKNFNVYENPMKQQSQKEGDSAERVFSYARWSGKIHRAQLVEDTHPEKSFLSGPISTDENGNKIKVLSPMIIESLKIKYIEKYAETIDRLYALFLPTTRGTRKRVFDDYNLKTAKTYSKKSGVPIDYSCMLVQLDIKLKDLLKYEGATWLQKNGIRINLAPLLTPPRQLDDIQVKTETHTKGNMTWTTSKFQVNLKTAQKVDRETPTSTNNLTQKTSMDKNTKPNGKITQPHLKQTNILTFRSIANSSKLQ